jgi:hypothetical protein
VNLNREALTPLERRLLGALVVMTSEARRRRDSALVGWLLVAASLGIAAGLAWVAMVAS